MQARRTRNEEEYSPRVWDHFLNPRNAGELQDATGVGTARNPRCGDLIKLCLRIEGDVVRDARARTFGCAAAIACSSALTELLKGRSVAEARRLTNRDVVSFLGGLPEHKIACSLVAEEAVRNALAAAAESTGGAIDPA